MDQTEQAEQLTPQVQLQERQLTQTQATAEAEETPAQVALAQREWAAHLAEVQQQVIRLFSEDSSSNSLEELRSFSAELVETAAHPVAAQQVQREEAEAAAAVPQV